MENTKALDSLPETLARPSQADLVMLNRLVEQSGWNQTAHDWQVFETLGSIHVIRDAQNTIVSSGAVLPLDTTAAWISMILVTPSRRGHGLGRAIFQRCLDEVQKTGRVALLDATPAGEALYSQYGFTSQWHLRRWHRSARTPTAAAPDPGSMSAQDPAGSALPEDNRQAIATLAALDAKALGITRDTFIDKLAARPGSRLVRRADAMAIVRDGRFARHVGPLVSSSEAAAAALLYDICESESAELLIDVPESRQELHIQLEAMGFAPQRGFARMSLGEPAPVGLTAFIHAIAGPEYG